eukprot:4162414-Amphidinium_carterae.1
MGWMGLQTPYLHLLGYRNLPRLLESPYPRHPGRIPALPRHLSPKCISADWTHPEDRCAHKLSRGARVPVLYLLVGYLHSGCHRP